MAEQECKSVLGCVDKSTSCLTLVPLLWGVVLFPLLQFVYDLVVGTANDVSYDNAEPDSVSQKRLLRVFHFRAVVSQKKFCRFIIQSSLAWLFSGFAFGSVFQFDSLSDSCLYVFNEQIEGARMWFFLSVTLLGISGILVLVFPINFILALCNAHSEEKNCSPPLQQLIRHLDELKLIDQELRCGEEAIAFLFPGESLVRTASVAFAVFQATVAAKRAQCATSALQQATLALNGDALGALGGAQDLAQRAVGDAKVAIFLAVRQSIPSKTTEYFRSVEHRSMKAVEEAIASVNGAILRRAAGALPAPSGVSEEALASVGSTATLSTVAEQVRQLHAQFDVQVSNLTLLVQSMISVQDDASGILGDLSEVEALASNAEREAADIQRQLNEIVNVET